MSEQANKPKTAAWKTWHAWSRDAAELLREKGVDLNKMTLETQQRIDAMVVAKAHAESIDQPKIMMTFHYPMGIFFNEHGGLVGDALEKALPKQIVIGKLHIPFSDGSLLMIHSPSEETLLAASYIKMLMQAPDLASAMGIDSKRIAAVKQVAALVESASRAVPLEREDLRAVLSQMAHLGRQAPVPCVQINCSQEMATPNQAVGILLDFLQRPTDTVTLSADQMIRHEFGAQAS